MPMASDLYEPSYEPSPDFDPELHDYHSLPQLRNLPAILEGDGNEAAEREAKRQRVTKEPGDVAMYATEKVDATLAAESGSYVRQKAREQYFSRVAQYNKPFFLLCVCFCFGTFGCVYFVPLQCICCGFCVCLRVRVGGCSACRLRLSGGPRQQCCNRIDVRVCIACRYSPRARKYLLCEHCGAEVGAELFCSRFRRSFPSSALVYNSAIMDVAALRRNLASRDFSALQIAEMEVAVVRAEPPLRPAFL